MANSIKYGFRVKETSTTTGTGTYTLAGAATAHQSFGDEFSNGDECYYVATDGTDWEYGVGTVGGSGSTLARTSVIQSTNSNNAVNWSAGTRDIFCPSPVEFFQHFAISDVPPVTRPVATGNESYAMGHNATASGSDAIAMGPSATASANGSVAIGSQADATGSSSICLMGGESGGLGSFAFRANAMASDSVAMGGGCSVAEDADHSFAIGDNADVMEASLHSFAMGHDCIAGVSGTSNTDTCWARGDSAHAYLQGMDAFSHGHRSTVGDAQRFVMHLTQLTTNATQTTMVPGRHTSQISGHIDLVDDRVYVFDGLVGAWQHGGTAGSVGDAGAYHIRGAIKRVGGTTSLLGTVTVTVIGEDQAAWDVDAVANDTTDRLEIRVTGEADKSIHWSAHIHFVEVG